MAVVSGACLYEGQVSGDLPLVAGAKAELYRRCIGARGADRAERVDDRRATGPEGGSAGECDLLAEVGACRIVVEQNGRIRLSALVPGCRTLQRQPGDDP